MERLLGEVVLEKTDLVIVANVRTVEALPVAGFDVDWLTRIRDQAIAHVCVDYDNLVVELLS